MDSFWRFWWRYDWWRLIRRHYFIVVIALLMSWVYMGTSLTSCSSTLIGSIGGDHINGIIWLLKYTAHPYGGISTMSNFPFHEDVAQPTLITSASLMVPTWIISKVVGSVCAWNLMVLFGYMSTALLMYAFVYWLLRHRGIALFAGLALAFTPYHYWNTWGHLSYIQSEVFVAILWSFLAFWRRPSRPKSILLGLLSAGLIYTDGYFALLGGVMLGTLALYVLVIGYFGLRYKKTTTDIYIRKVKLLLLSLGVAVVAVLPILFVSYHYRGRVNATFATTRGNAMADADVYGARPADYVLPSQTSPFPAISRLVNNYRNAHVYSNTGEYHLYLGFVTLVLALGAVIYGFYILLKKDLKKLAVEDRWLLWVIGACASVAIAAIVTSFAPSVTIFGFEPIWPSRVIVHLTGYWRVFARLYLVVSLAVVSLAAIGLWYLTRRFKSPRARFIVLAIVILLSTVELLPINPFNRTDEWSLKTASPTYWWLRNQKNIKDIAAYPLLEQPLGDTYFGDQVIHQKPLLNSYLSTDPERYLHQALTGLEDPQTLGVLKSLGVDDVLLYRVNIPASDNNLHVLYGNFGARVAQISPSVAPLGHALVPDFGYDTPVVDSQTDTSCRVQNQVDGMIHISKVTPKASPNFTASFDIKGQPGQTAIVHIGGQVIDAYTFTSPNQVHHEALAVNANQVIGITQLVSTPNSAVSLCDLGVSD